MCRQNTGVREVVASQDCDNHTLLTGGGGGGTSSYELFRYESSQRVCFSKPLRSDFDQYAFKLGLVSR